MGKAKTIVRVWVEEFDDEGKRKMQRGSAVEAEPGVEVHVELVERSGKKHDVELWQN